MADTDPLKKRLAQLQREHEAGARALAAIDEQRRDLSQTMLRIEGAAALLREMIAEVEKPQAEPAPRANGAAPEPPPPAAETAATA